MEKNVRAFYYDYKYYLFPAETGSVEALSKCKEVTAVRLREELCMAPDFIYESMVSETFEIEDPARIFEVSVNLYTHEEYDGLLWQQVKQVCADCVNYEDDGDESLNGHHREISLDGVCNLKEREDEAPSFADCAEYFWGFVRRNRDKIIDYINKGDQKKLNKLLGDVLAKFCPPIEFYGGVHMGKYCLCMTVEWGYSSAYICLCAYLAFVGASRLSDDELKILPLRPEGVFHCDKPYKKNASFAKLSPSENPNRLDITLFHAKAKKLDGKALSRLCKNAYDNLVELIGEDKVYAVIGGVDFSDGEEDMLTVSEAAEEIKAKYAEGFGEEPSFPPSFAYSVTETNESRIFPKRGLLSDGITSCEEMTFLDYDGLAESPWWLEAVNFAYLYFPVQPDDGLNTLLWYISHTDLVPEPLRSPNEKIAGTMIGMAYCGEQGFMFDNMIVDEKAFYRKLRYIAPVLEAFGAELYVVRGKDVSAYKCGYTLTPIEREG